MKKTALLFALYATIIAQGTCYASAPSRTYNYVAGQTISSAQVNTNEISLYSYLQNGVEVLAANSVTDTAVSASANIQYSKLNLAGQILNADISSSTTIDYTKLNLTGKIVNADISASAAIADSKLATITTASKVNTSAITGTLGVSNGGTGQTTAQAAIDALLPSQGSASGKFLTSNGSASSWGTVTTYTPSVKFGSFSRTPGTGSGSVNYTGVGFQPTSIMFFVPTYGTNNYSYGGYGTNNANYCTYTSGGAGAGTSTTYSIVQQLGGANYSESGAVSSMGADGFTIAWTTAAGSDASAAFTVFYVATK